VPSRELEVYHIETASDGWSKSMKGIAGGGGCRMRLSLFRGGGS
jgi:hypothetical protein